MDPIKVLCTTCSKELYAHETLQETPDGPRWCFVCYNAKAQAEAEADALRGPKLADSVERFLDEVVKNL